MLASAGLLMVVVAPSDRGAVWFGAAVSWVVQLGAFAVLLRVKDNPQLFMMGWVGGMVLRFITVGMAVLVLSRTPLFPMRAALLSLIGFVFMLTLLEPVFLRRVRATP
jgi:hypothetical protein